MPYIPKPSAVILDVDGTTSSIKFYSTALQPFLKEKFRTFLHKRWDTQPVQLAVRVLRKESRKAGNETAPVIANENDSTDIIRRSVLSYVIYQLNNPNKMSQTKAVQNLHLLAFLYGFEEEGLQGHVFDDVPLALHRWKQKDIRVFLYSSAQKMAQKLFYSKTLFGNLLPVIDGYFDGKTGRKTEPKSYRKISERIGASTNKMLFVSDNPHEISAAKAAGCMVLLCERPKNHPLSSNDRNMAEVVRSFGEIRFT